jgi:hypothetical protein
MEISDPCAGILIYSLFPSRSCFGSLLFLLSFISSLPQLVWENGSDVIVVIVAATNLEREVSC